LSARHIHRVATVVVAVSVTLFVTALPASAHVSVSSPDATPGGFGKLVFRVPTESEKASTTKVAVDLPKATPFAFVSTKPLPGWQVVTTERKLDKPVKAEGFTLTKAVGTVTWTAAPGQGLGPGQFDEFELSVGPFPKKPGTLVMPATQTYSDGQVVRWDQPTPASGEEPEHPAPTLEVKQASPVTAVKPAAETTADSADDLARWLGAGGLLLGALALVLSFLLGRRGGRSS
jgi:uncharacterized protein YcnI